MSSAEDSDFVKLQKECQRLEARLTDQTRELNLLKARFSRYEEALRSSRVTVCTQDRDLRYTSISNPMLGRTIEEILGHTDEDLLPSDSSTGIIALKHEVLANGQPARREVAVDSAAGACWYDVHIGPLRSEAGEIIGVTCVSIDITERKEAETHLRLLLRELTHRSKNLLAVIQAMARQTARYAGSIDGFLNQFGARLQALAASHDLLVRESWYGASLHELIQSQLARFIERGAGQVTFDGPSVALKPEAAQNLGLALHELAINAEKYGSLSVPKGRVSVTWDLRAESEGRALKFEWHEQLGPKVKVRRKKGFGSIVIERNLARALDAEVTMDFDPDGLHCHIVIPASQILGAR